MGLIAELKRRNVIRVALAQRSKLRQPVAAISMSQVTLEKISR